MVKISKLVSINVNHIDNLFLLPKDMIACFSVVNLRVAQLIFVALVWELDLHCIVYHIIKIQKTDVSHICIDEGIPFSDHKETEKHRF